MKRFFLALLLVSTLVIAAAAIAADQPTFPLITPNGPLTSGQIQTIKIIPDQNAVAIDIAQGWVNPQGAFQAFGTQGIYLKDDSTVTPAVTDFTDFMSGQANGTIVTIPQLITFLQGKGKIGR
jgi:hypothetical protein